MEGGCSLGGDGGGIGAAEDQVLGEARVGEGAEVVDFWDGDEGGLRGSGSGRGVWRGGRLRGEGGGSGHCCG